MRAPTPDAVLRGVEVLAEVVGGDVLVVDVGGATTDVYSVITPQGEDATIHREVVGTLWHARTVEADLGMRWTAEGVVEAAERERLPLDPTTRSRYAARRRVRPGPPRRRPRREWAAEEEIAATAAVVAVRRHGRPPHPSERPRPLADVALVVGLRRCAPARPPATSATACSRGSPTTTAAGGGCPSAAHRRVDTAYVLFAVGLLADRLPGGRGSPGRCRCASVVPTGG